MDATPGDAELERLLAHSDWLNALARRLVGDPTVADDIVQDTWRAALEGGRSTAVRNERGWLATLLANFARRHARGESARRLRERASSANEAIAGPDELVERAEAQRRLLSALLSLEEPYRSTLLARYVEGSTPARIAVKTGVNESTVRTRLARGHAELRARLARESGSTWALALAPLCTRGLFEGGGGGASSSLAAAGASTGSGLLLGAWIMGTGTKLAIAGVVAALAAWLLWPETRATNSVRVPSIAEEAPAEIDAPRETLAASTPLARTAEHDATDAAPAPSAASKPTPQPAPAETSWIELELRRGSAPIAGAGVWIAPSMAWLMIDCLDLEGALPEKAKFARTDANGVARFAARPGEQVSVGFDLRADAKRPWRFVTAAMHAGYHHVIELGDASIHGTVYDSSGRPRAGVGVMASSTKPDRRYLYLAAMTRTDEHGRYELTDIAPVNFVKSIAPTIVVMDADGRFDGRGVTEQQQVALEADRSLTVDFGGPGGRPTLSGRVLTRGGKPFPEGGRLVLKLDDESGELQTMLDAEGKFALVFTPKTWHAFAFVAGAPSDGFDLGVLELPAYDTVRDLVVKGARVFGRLLAADGRVLPEDRPWVSLHLKGHDYPGAFRTVVSEADGFAFEGVEPGEWVIGIHPFDLVPGEVVDFTLGPNDVEHQHDLHVKVRD